MTRDIVIATLVRERDNAARQLEVAETSHSLLVSECNTRMQASAMTVKVYRDIRAEYDAALADLGYEGEQ